MSMLDIITKKKLGQELTKADIIEFTRGAADGSIPDYQLAALLMAICGVLMKKCKMSWLEQYALPISMLGAMALSIPITALMQ